MGTTNKGYPTEFHLESKKVVDFHRGMMNTNGNTL
jgi:hypothetical protein